MICAVGLTCLDIMNFVKKFPEEDADIRCTKKSWERGGNASNNCSVLSCLGQPVEYFGTFANDPLLQFFKNDMDSYGIKYNNCPIIEGVGRAPSSVVICSEETGTRTIVHSNGGLCELSLDDFKNRIDLQKYSWIHFEGRNEEIVVKMLELINEYNEKNSNQLTLSEAESIPSYKKVLLPVSVEVERVRETLEKLIPLANIVFVGKDFAKFQGANDCVEAAKLILPKVKPGTLIICPWGDKGASFCVKNGNDSTVYKVDAYPPEKVIDSLGAGDTFIASTIFCLNKGIDIQTSVRVGCKIASKKLELYGFRGLKNIASTVSELNSVIF